ncbi:MAG: hypothetical protein HOH33_01985 [Verrucomicrobia bacterium]|jgi:hypothetical protein|nr:hypothetical protein [Verrucomicrobiota bacterium]
MLAKYHIEYSVRLGRHDQLHHIKTDDPVACEEYLVEILERGFHINTIMHEGVELAKMETDKMIKTAASLLAARKICQSLKISSEEERYRFGFSA